VLAPPPANDEDAEDLLALLHEQPALRHLRVRRRGSVLTVESGSKTDPALHVRLCRATKHLWTLEVATHTGRWQPTGERRTMPALVQLLCQRFPWVLAPLG
jgi:hypothetical protein